MTASDMKRLTHIGTAFACVLAISACAPKREVRDKPAPGPQPKENTSPGRPTLDPNGSTDTGSGPSGPDRGPVTPPVTVPDPVSQPKNPEYAVKIDGKPGYVQSPYDGAKRMIDVRGLPPGTEAECPYTHRTFLVPP